MEKAAETSKSVLKSEQDFLEAWVCAVCEVAYGFGFIKKALRILPEGLFLHKGKMAKTLSN